MPLLEAGSLVKAYFKELKIRLVDIFYETKSFLITNGNVYLTVPMMRNANLRLGICNSSEVLNQCEWLEDLGPAARNVLIKAHD